MAQKQQRETFSRHFTKLDAFLKRVLGNFDYQKIRAYDPCIVICEELKENKSHKFIIVDDEWIYFTENPPKSFRKVFHLKDLIDIETVNDFPEFLFSKNERDSCQHFRFRFITDPKAEKEMPITLKTSRSIKSTSRSSVLLKEMDTSKAMYSVRSLPAELTKSVNLASNTLTSRSFSSATMAKSGHYSKEDFFAAKALMEFKDDMPKTSEPQLSSRSAKKKKKKDHNSDLTILEEDIEDEGLQSARGKPKSKLPDDSDLKLQLNEEPSPEGSNSSMDNTLKSKEQIGPLGEVEEVEKNKSWLCTPRNKKSTTDEMEEGRIALMDVFILNETSRLKALCLAARDNYVLRSTLMKDDWTNFKTDPLLYTRVISTGDRQWLLYQQLLLELRYARHSLEDFFILLRELRQGAERHFIIRKCFWKNADGFDVLSTELCRFLPRSPVRLDTEKGKERRSDELELCLYIIETLAIMMRETEIIPSRTRCICAKKGTLLRNLLKALCTEPELPEPLDSGLSDSRRVAFHLNEEEVSDDELLDQRHDLVSAASGLLWELSLLGRQCVWCADETDFFTADWMFKYMADNDLMTYIIAELASLITHRLSPLRMLPLLPQSLVITYQQVDLLLRIIIWSDDLLLHVKQEHREEFKYYIHPEVVCRKVKRGYTISEPLITLLEDLLTRLLDRNYRIAVLWPAVEEGKLRHPWELQGGEKELEEQVAAAQNPLDDMEELAKQVLVEK